MALRDFILELLLHSRGLELCAGALRRWQVGMAVCCVGVKLLGPLDVFPGTCWHAGGCRLRISRL